MQRQGRRTSQPVTCRLRLHSKRLHSAFSPQARCTRTSRSTRRRGQWEEQALSYLQEERSTTIQDIPLLGMDFQPQRLQHLQDIKTNRRDFVKHLRKAPTCTAQAEREVSPHAVSQLRQPCVTFRGRPMPWRCPSRQVLLSPRRHTSARTGGRREGDPSRPLRACSLDFEAHLRQRAEQVLSGSLPLKTQSASFQLYALPLKADRKHISGSGRLHLSVGCSETACKAAPEPKIPCDSQELPSHRHRSASKHLQLPVGCSETACKASGSRAGSWFTEAALLFAKQ